MPELNRRTFLKMALGAGAAAALVPTLAAYGDDIAGAAGAAGAAGTGQAFKGHDPVTVHWIEGAAPAKLAGGVTWGVPWPKGALADTAQFALNAEDGTDVPLQSWVTGWWPDGSVKWTAHAFSDDAAKSGTYKLTPGKAPAQGKHSIAVSDGTDIVVDTGVIKVTFPKSGTNLISSIVRNGVEIARNGRLVASVQDVADSEQPTVINRRNLASAIESAEVENQGTQRALVHVKGRHADDKGGLLPFDVRFYLYAGSDGLRVVHNFIYDGDQQKDFVKSLGITFDVPFQGAEAWDRHVRFAGQDGGVFGEAIQPVTGLRRDPDKKGTDFKIKESQVAGVALPSPDKWDPRVSGAMQYVPKYGDYSLTQLNPNGFEIRKRTGKGMVWIRSDAGKRAAGLGYVGSPKGGLAFGLRDFWKRYPAELAVTNGAADAAQATVWLWSPNADSMDLRTLHDGLGQDTYEKQTEGLNITYEDWEKGFDTPYGIGNTHELMFWALAATPSRTDFATLAAANALPPMLASDPQHNHSAHVFGSWAPVDRSTPLKNQIEDGLKAKNDFYHAEVDQRSWYGFWDYGDVMHTYDDARHMWCYDIGGYAWDNSELSSDLGFWYYYLHTGDGAAYRFAEAMFRHCSEVDTYHAGRFRRLGTRHGVLHYGDSGKQNRISNATYRRIYYFLTADERAGDILHDLVTADQTFMLLDPNRKVRTDGYTPSDPSTLDVSNVLDWGVLSAAWFTEWERRGPDAEIAHTKLLNSAKSIAAMPNGFMQGGTMKYNLADGKYQAMTEQTLEVGSLDFSFGQVQMIPEIIDSLGENDVRDAWLEYCRLYGLNNNGQEVQDATGVNWKANKSGDMFSGAVAWAGVQLNDDGLKERAKNMCGWLSPTNTTLVDIGGADALNPVKEAPGMAGTNGYASGSIGIIQCLALIPEKF